MPRWYLICGVCPTIADLGGEPAGVKDLLLPAGGGALWPPACRGPQQPRERHQHCLLQRVGQDWEGDDTGRHQVRTGCVGVALDGWQSLRLCIVPDRPWCDIEDMLVMG